MEENTYTDVVTGFATQVAFVLTKKDSRENKIGRDILAADEFDRERYGKNVYRMATSLTTRENEREAFNFAIIVKIENGKLFYLADYENDGTEFEKRGLQIEVLNWFIKK